ncbi:YlzJ-like family protein [Paenibacillus glufosinatiresistens]|uniref:YlzJ-like family protein n=1 Tax=Paenibacillus glufosinatiresistens TaxID=3070657 RepID=UPI00286DA032|nr:YlzJ-like family protein [Paenibacillus sp. YX.27]
MTLYTVASMDLVWEGALAPVTPLCELRIGGMVMEAEPLPEGQYRIVRLLAGPLNLYLDSRFAPGSVIGSSLG